jgi:hypothetical protein
LCLCITIHLLNSVDIIEDYLKQTASVFRLSDKKAFFDWNHEYFEKSKVTPLRTAEEERRIKASKKRERMIEGLKEKWYSFLMLDAIRFASGGGINFIMNDSSSGSRSHTLNMKYFNQIGTFNLMSDGDTPFYRR